MALFRRGLPRGAVVGAFLGFVYGVIVMPTGGTPMILAGIGWILLSVSLLFGRTYSYFTFIGWALLWAAWKGVLAFRGAGGPWIGVALDIALPLLAVALLSGSGYLGAVQEPLPE